MIEIGPRMQLQLIRIFQGFMGGQTLYLSKTYKSPGQIRKENKDRIKKIQKKREIIEEKKKKVKNGLENEKSDGESFEEFITN